LGENKNSPNIGPLTFHGLSQKTIVLDPVVIPFFTGVLTEGLKINGFLENTAKVIAGEIPYFLI
jgi:hypothetical protein